MSEDEEFHKQMQQRYLVYYQAKQGGRFSIETTSTARLANYHADLFNRDGYPARVMKISVVDDQPVAEWVEES